MEYANIIKLYIYIYQYLLWNINYHTINYLLFHHIYIIRISLMLIFLFLRWRKIAKIRPNQLLPQNQTKRKKLM